MEKNYEIECLRGIAILFTLIHHIPTYLLAGSSTFFVFLYSHATFWGGVDLFFVISGFVIMKSFNKTVHKFDFNFYKSLKYFWYKRGFRILPAAWFWLIVYLMATKFTNYTGAFGNIQQNIKDSIAAVLQYANIYGTRDSRTESGPNGIYWSLSLEEQFYMLFPLFFIYFRKHFAYFLILIGLCQLFINRPEWSLGWAIRTDGFVWGVLIAHWSEKISYKNFELYFFKLNFILKKILIFSSVLGMAYLPAGPNNIKLGTGFLALVCALLVFVASFDKGYLIKNGICKKVLIWLGTRSYSLYLTHIIGFRLSYEILNILTHKSYKITNENTFELLAISIPLVLGMTQFSYYFIEKRSRDFGYKFVNQIRSL